MAEKQGMNDVADRAFRRHYDQVYRYVRRRTHDHHRAEELTQQVFADAARSLRETGTPAFADEVKKRGAHVDSVPAPEAVAYGQALASALGRALEGLPEGQRQVVVLKLLRGARFAEVAGVLGITEAAAKMRFVRALEALRTELEKEGVTP